MNECRRCGYMQDACTCVTGFASTIDMIRHPPHYISHPSGVECIDIVRHMNFNLGNAIKYVWRAGEKGRAVEDLKKARWYIEDEIKRIGGEP